MSEVNQLYSQGLKGYFESYYNYVDSLCISIYMASYALRLITQYNVNLVAVKYEAPLTRAKEIITNKTMFYDPIYSFEYYKIVKELFDEDDSYFLRGGKYVISVWCECNKIQSTRISTTFICTNSYSQQILGQTEGCPSSVYILFRCTSFYLYCSEMIHIVTHQNYVVIYSNLLVLEQTTHSLTVTSL